MTTSSAIDAGFVGRHADGVAGGQFGSETVLVDTNRSRSHVLNPTASLVWMLLDGSATLGELCADIAAELSVPYETVLGDAVGVVEQLVALDVVVDGAHPLPPSAPAPAPTPAPAATWFD